MCRLGSQSLDIQPDDNALEVGSGPGVGIELLTTLASAGYVAGVDISVEIVEQAKARIANGIKSGRVDLRYGSVEKLPFEDNLFDQALRLTRCKSGRMP
jgi:ubiquinone/menaquinone biosynthesis C-methylase UbiE